MTTVKTENITAVELGTVERVAVRNLMVGDVLIATGEVVKGVYSDSKTPKGKKVVIVQRPDREKARVAVWNANTLIGLRRPPLTV